MKEVLKDIKLGQIIGIYHFEDSCFTVGKILKISSKYLFLLFEKEEYKNFKIITTIDNKESMAYDLFYYENYLIFSEKEEFYDISKINIISKNKIENISDIEIKLDIKKEN
ncbi:hypothetical protein ACDQ58_10790, partial [Fusobacterium animalis]